MCKITSMEVIAIGTSSYFQEYGQQRMEQQKAMLSQKVTRINEVCGASFKGLLGSIRKPCFCALPAFDFVADVSVSLDYCIEC